MPEPKDYWWELDMRDADRRGFWRGLVFGVPLSLLVWAMILAVAVWWQQ